MVRESPGFTVTGVERVSSANLTAKYLYVVGIAGLTRRIMETFVAELSEGVMEPLMVSTTPVLLLTMLGVGDREISAHLLPFVS